MSKALLISILIAPILLPALSASAKNPKKALRQALKRMTYFYLFYLFVLVALYGRI